MSIYGMSDRRILEEIGGRLRRKRLEQNLSQQQIADAAGLNRTTVGEIERGASTSLLTLIQLLRALNALEELEAFLPDPGPSPLELARQKTNMRRRASKRKSGGNKGGSEW